MLITSRHFHKNKAQFSYSVEMKYYKNKVRIEKTLTIEHFNGREAKWRKPIPQATLKMQMKKIIIIFQ